MITLSIEQMKHLQELGLDTSDAKMFWSKYICTVPNPLGDGDIDQFGNIEHLYCKRSPFEPYSDAVDTYTLQEVIDKLPKDIPHGEDVCPLYIVPNYYNPKEWEIIYSMPVYLSGVKHSETNENLLQGCYDMLCWCIENKYMK